MRHITHFLAILRKIFSTSYAYNKMELLWDYCRITGKSVVYHKITRQRRKIHAYERREKVLGFTIHFFGYPELLHLIEEIFIYQVYKPSSDTISPLIVDCGSNIGLSVLYFKKLFPTARILAFEPDRETFLMLGKNIRSNNLKDVTLFNIALHHRECEVVLHKKPHSPGSLGMSLFDSEGMDKEAVPAKRLSDFIQDKVDLLKMDVEGSEINLITDMVDSDKLNLVKEMVIEYHPARANMPVEEFMRWLETYQFSCTADKNDLYRGATEILVSCRRV